MRLQGKKQSKKTGKEKGKKEIGNSDLPRRHKETLDKDR